MRRGLAPAAGRRVRSRSTVVALMACTRSARTAIVSGRLSAARPFLRRREPLTGTRCGDHGLVTPSCIERGSAPGGRPTRAERNISHSIVHTAAPGTEATESAGLSTAISGAHEKPQPAAVPPLCRFGRESPSMVAAVPTAAGHSNTLITSSHFLEEAPTGRRPFAQHALAATFVNTRGGTGYELRPCANGLVRLRDPFDLRRSPRTPARLRICRPHRRQRGEGEAPGSH